MNIVIPTTGVEPSGLSLPSAVAQSPVLLSVLQNAVTSYTSGSADIPDEVGGGLALKEECTMSFPSGSELRVETGEWFLAHVGDVGAEWIKIEYRPSGTTRTGRKKNLVKLIEWGAGHVEGEPKEAKQKAFRSLKSELGLENEYPTELVVAAALSRAISLQNFRNRYCDLAFPQYGIDGLENMPVFEQAIRIMFGLSGSK